MRFTIHDDDGHPTEVDVSGQRFEGGSVVVDVTVNGTGKPKAVTLVAAGKPAAERTATDNRKTGARKAPARKAQAKRAAPAGKAPAKKTARK